MPRQENQNKVEVRLERENVNGDPYDVLYIDNKEIVAFHLKNIDFLQLKHNSDEMVKLIQGYFNNVKIYSS